MSVRLSEALRHGGVADVLVRIVERRQQRYAQRRGPASTVQRSAATSQAFPDALRAARTAGRSAVIAEVKMGSPKLGDLRRVVDPERQALLYRRGGAAALSVVVEPDFFRGSYELLSRCVEASGLPAIAKDFVVSEHQLDEAAAAGAAAVLLIAALYDAGELHRLGTLVRERGMTPLVETHTPEDVAKLRRQTPVRGATLTPPGDDPRWEIVGVNNRDLRTFAVDLQHSIDLLPDLPPGALRVAESGLAERGDLERLESAGFDAFLIGESLLLASDPAAKLAELLGVSDSRGARRSAEASAP
jgi:indole-3-glycerol phosphate synthase